MRIVYITPFFQHPLMQGPTRHYHFIRELSQRHSITLLTPTKSPIPSEAMQEMTAYTERILTFNAIPYSKSSAPNGSRVLSKFSERVRQMRRRHKAVRKMKTAFLGLMQQKSYDVVLFHGKSVFSVIEDWDDLPIVADVCDATSLRIAGMMRYTDAMNLPLFLLRYLFARRVEQKLVRKTPHLAFISGRDREAVLGPNSRAKIVPNFVDLQYWTRKTNSPKLDCIMYSGGMDYRPNVDGALYLLRQILPLVRQSIPDLQVLIVGRDPVPELVEAAQGCSNVTLTGSVPDMRPYFEQATVCVAPLRFASGQQNKLLEALAMEVPVVTTPVAAEGVCVDNAEAPLLVAEDEKQFAECTIRLLKNEKERAYLAAEGRRFIEDHFAWSRSAEVLEQMCVDAVQQNKVILKET